MSSNSPDVYIEQVDNDNTQHQSSTEMHYISDGGTCNLNLHNGKFAFRDSPEEDVETDDSQLLQIENNNQIV